MPSEQALKAVIIIISDTAAQDASQDKSQAVLSSVFQAQTNVAWKIHSTQIIPDKITAIQNTINGLCNQDALAESGLNLIVTTGGTGFATKDVTPEAIEPLLEKKAPGLVHGMLAKSLEITPFAMMSRPVVGVKNGVVIVTLPGSPKGAKENLEAIIKLLPHACLQASGMDSRVLHAGGTKKLEQDAGISSSSVPSQQAGSGHHHHDHSHNHNHSHGHGHVIPRTHTRPEERPQSNDHSADPTQRYRESPYPMLSVREAITTILSHASSSSQTYKPIPHHVGPSLLGYILAEDITAHEAVPAFRASIVDGYALIAGPSAPNTKGIFPVASISHASPGSIPPLEPGQIARITTGAPLPPGATAVVMVEDTLIKSKTADGKEEKEVEILTDAIQPNENVREIGSDIAKGSLLLKKGTKLGPGEIGLLASDGRAEVMVFQKPLIGVLSTGDEIVEHTRPEPLRLGEVRDCNRPAVAAVLESYGFHVNDLGIAKDTPGALESSLREALRLNDVLVTTGGVSMGELDLLKPTLERSLGGTIHFGRVSMKPGKPSTFATVPVKDNAGHQVSKAVFSLPGNPASAITCTNLFVLPYLAKAMGEDIALLSDSPDVDEWRGLGLPRVNVVLDESVKCDKAREEYQRANVVFGKDGRLSARTTGGQRSSRVGSFLRANALLVLPAGGGMLEKGSVVEALVIGEIRSG